MLRKLDDTVALEQMGFKPFVPGSADLDPCQSLIAEEDFDAKLVANLTLGDIGNRYRILSGTLQGWPGRYDGFVPILPELFEETCHTFKHDYLVWQMMLENGNTEWWDYVKHRSMCVDTTVDQLVALTEVTNWHPYSVPEVLVGLLRTLV